VITRVAAAHPAKAFLGRPFYFGMAILAAAIVTYGFSRTIDAGLIHPSFVVPAILYVHVALFTGWIVLLLVQTGLIQAHHVRWHRTIGLSSIGFGAALVVVGLWVSVVMARIEAQQGDAQAGPFLAVPVGDMLIFGTLFGLGVWYRKRIETHRRLMLMAALSLTGAAFGRFPTFIVPHGGWFYLAADMMIFIGVVRDLLVQRRVHRVYAIGLPLVMLTHLVTIGIRYSHWWAVASQSFIR